MRTIVIGDVHGMLQELVQLLELVQYREGDRVICVGDLVDKGPDSVGVVELFRARDFECVYGNHEDWYVRFGKHESLVAFTPGYKNPMQRKPEKVAIYDRLRTEELLWMATLPTFIRISPDWVVVHGGVLPGHKPESMKKEVLCRLRYVDSNSKRFAPLRRDLSKPDHAELWVKYYDGKEHVIYGHEPFVELHRSCLPECGVTWGIDTGAAYGGKLTALLFEGPILKGTEPVVLNVSASKAYADRAREDE